MKLFLKIGLIITFLFALQNLYAFQSWCHTDQFTEAEKDIIENTFNYSNKTQIEGVITIPVVFHIVYNNEEQNIDDSLIYSQMEVINEDFRKSNTDIIDIREVFKDLATDVEIEFCLAGIDPEGNPTTGITRTVSSIEQHTVNGIKYDSSGGEDIWPRENYLNIWVGVFKSNILGYSRFPWQGNSKIDGIVLKYSEVGRSSVNRGRVLTHEIGHWFGLYHTFDGGCPFSAAYNCETSGDWICDTPPIVSATAGCNGNNTNSCNEFSNDQIDMWENFMDYTDGQCRLLFTTQQVERMRNYLNTEPRNSLLSSSKCGGFFSSINSSINEQSSFTINTIVENKIYELVFNEEVTSGNITIYNLQGQGISSQYIYKENNFVKIDLSSFSSGLYILDYLDIQNQKRSIAKLYR